MDYQADTYLLVYRVHACGFCNPEDVAIDKQHASISTENGVEPGLCRHGFYAGRKLIKTVKIYINELIYI